MAGEWVNAQLQEIAAEADRAFAMGPFGSNIRAENYCESGIPVIRGTNLGEAGEAPFKPDEFVFLTEEKADELASSNAYPNDIVFVAQGTVGKVGIIPSNTPYRRFVLSQNLMKVTLNPELADARFVFYFFRSVFGQHEIMSRVNPTGVPCISKPLTSLRQFGVRLPSNVSEQLAIAHILSTLDDRIDLKRQMNETLEAIARAIFKSWFVDFDPVRAKMEGRWKKGQSMPGLPAELWDLFPDSFEDSELGEIPRGWEVMRVGDALEAVGGGTPSTSEPDYWDGGKYCWATPKDLSGLAAPILLDTERKITEAGLSQISSGLLPAGAVLMSSRAPVGYLALSAVPVAINQGFIAMICHGPVSNLYTLNWCYFKMDEIKQRASGTTFAEISKAAFRPILMLVPEKKVMQMFTGKVQPFYSAIQKNLEQSWTLAALRDALLPKLISGELRVKDPERFIGRHV
jgi:type I restriction enzyme S subunit